MGDLRKRVVEVVDNRIAKLRARSVELNQETRISIYVFNDTVKCLVFDMDVMRAPSIKNLYNPSGMTALLDGTSQCIDDLKQIPQLYSDHAFFVTVVTDGQENRSRKVTALNLAEKIQKMEENWTIACMVPDQDGVFEAKKHGFPEGNVAVWSVSETGLESAGKQMDNVMDDFMVKRAQGVRGSRNLFTADLSKVTVSEIKSVLKEVDPSKYKTMVVSLNATKIRPLIRKDAKGREMVWISEYVQAMVGSYNRGDAFYKIDKKETIQASKRIAIRHKTTKKVFAGPEARQVLGLPTGEIKLAPGDHGDWDLFIESTSTNRSLFEKTEILVLLSASAAGV